MLCVLVQTTHVKSLEGELEEMRSQLSPVGRAGAYYMSVIESLPSPNFLMGDSTTGSWDAICKCAKQRDCENGEGLDLLEVQGRFFEVLP